MAARFSTIDDSAVSTVSTGREGTAGYRPLDQALVSAGLHLPSCLLLLPRRLRPSSSSTSSSRLGDAVVPHRLPAATNSAKLEYTRPLEPTTLTLALAALLAAPAGTRATADSVSRTTTGSWNLNTCDTMHRDRDGERKLEDSGGKPEARKLTASR